MTESVSRNIARNMHIAIKSSGSDVDIDQTTEISNLPDIAIDIDISILP